MNLYQHDNRGEVILYRIEDRFPVISILEATTTGKFQYYGRP